VSFITKQLLNLLKDVIKDILHWAWDIVEKMILNLSTMDKYFDYKPMLFYIQIIAAALLITAAAYEIMKNISGNVFDSEDVPLSTYFIRVCISGMMIYLLPWSVVNIIIPLNNATINLINYVGVEFGVESIDKLSEFMFTYGNSMIMIVQVFILALSFLILGIIGGIRYFELLIVILISPIVAVSFIKKGQAANVWVREAVAITFTQAIHILVLQIVSTILFTVKGPMCLVLCIAAIVILIRGPQVLRKFLYSTGTGSTTIQAFGSMGRYKVMRMMMRK